MKKTPIYFLILILLCIGSWSGASFFRSQRLSHQSIIFHEPTLIAIQLNVGQGDAFLLISPDRKITLVDGGPVLDNRGYQWDAGLEVIWPTLKALGFEKIDTVVLTHHDQDHMGGILSLLGHVPIGEVFHNGEAKRTESYRHFLDLIARRHIPLSSLKEGDVLELGQYLQAQVLSPSGGQGWEDNNASLVLRVTFGHLKLLLTGDIELGSEQILCSRYGDGLHCDFLKSPHHGSKTSSSRMFLELVHPSLIGISVGKGNSYGHPSPQVLNRYANLCGSRFLRTDQDGAIMLLSNGTECVVVTQKGISQVLNLS